MTQLVFAKNKGNEASSEASLMYNSSSSIFQSFEFNSFHLDSSLLNLISPAHLVFHFGKFFLRGQIHLETQARILSPRMYRGMYIVAEFEIGGEDSLMDEECEDASSPKLK